jgi:hypothetical protein
MNNKKPPAIPSHHFTSLFNVQPNKAEAGWPMGRGSFSTLGVRAGVKNLLTTCSHEKAKCSPRPALSVVEVTCMQPVNDAATVNSFPLLRCSLPYLRHYNPKIPCTIYLPPGTHYLHFGNNLINRITNLLHVLLPHPLTIKGRHGIQQLSKRTQPHPFFNQHSLNSCHTISI